MKLVVSIAPGEDHCGIDLEVFSHRYSAYSQVCVWCNIGWYPFSDNLLLSSAMCTCASRQSIAMLLKMLLTPRSE